MDTEKCKALLCVIENKSLSLAADKLGYTPSGISRMIASMEQETGFPLLIRSRKGVRLTKECQKLLPVIQELSFLGKQYSQISSEIQGLEIGEISIGISLQFYYPWLTKLITEFIQTHPNIRMNIVEFNSERLLKKMNAHQLDLCMISAREGNHSWIHLQDDPMLAWLPPNHPLTEAEAFPVKAFETEDYIDTHPGQETDNARIFAKYKIKPNVKHTTNGIAATYSLVEAGVGISCDNALNAQGWTGNVVFKPLAPPQIVEIGIAIPSSEFLSPAAKKFVGFVKEHFKEYQSK